MDGTSKTSEQLRAELEQLLEEDRQSAAEQRVQPGQLFPAQLAAETFEDAVHAVFFVGCQGVSPPSPQHRA